MLVLHRRVKWQTCLVWLWILSAFPISAFAADPFAVIFGDEARPKVGADMRSVHEDNIRLVGVRLRDYPLIDVATAYDVGSSLCLEVQAVLEALGLPLKVERARLIGWVETDTRPVEIDLENVAGSIGLRPIDWTQKDAMKTPQSWCLSLDALTELTEIDFEYSSSTLTVTATPRRTLPLEARLERERTRKFLLAEAGAFSPDYPTLENPYRWVSLPTADFVFDFDTRQKSGLVPTVSFEAAADLLKTTARLRSVEGGDEQRRFRLTLGRTSEYANQFGFLGARQFSVGHISSLSMPLYRRSETGLGALITNTANYQPDQFDETDVVGSLPRGWEAELYSDDRLLAFTDTPDANGDYRFSAVPLMMGFNRLVVKLYGPYGEKDERVVTRFVGGAQCPEGQWRYTVAVIDPDTVQRIENNDLQGGGALEAETLDRKALTEGVRLTASLEHGLTKHLSARFDGESSVSSGFAASASLLGSFSRVHGGVRIASDGAGNPAVETFAQTRISDDSSLSIRITDFGDLESDYAGQGQGRLARQARLRFETRLGRGLGYLPLRNTMVVRQTDGGETNLSVSNVTGSNYRGVNWSHNLAYTRFGGAEGAANLVGGLIISKTIQGARLRAGLDYAVGEKASFKSVSISGQRGLGRDAFLQLSSAYDMETGAFGGETVLIKAFKAFTASARAGVSQSGQWHAGLNLAFSLHKPKDSWRYRMAQPGLSRAGSIRVLSYIDADSNHYFGEDDVAVPGVKYIVDNSLRSERSGVDGVNIVSGIDPNKTTFVETQLSSVEDPFLKPMQAGYRLSVRPGQVVTVQMPLRPTGDVDGVVQLVRNGHSTALAGVTVEIVDARGRVLDRVKTEYDGYFYADGIPVGPISIRVDEENVTLIGGSADPIDVFLTESEPSKTDILLSIETSG